MRTENPIRAAWTALRRSPTRTAIAAGVVIGAVVMGGVFGVAANAARNGAGVGQEPAPSTSPTPTPMASPTTAASPTATPATTATPRATPTATPAATSTPMPVGPMPSHTAAPTPTPRSVAGACDEVTLDSAGTVYVNGQRVDDPWGEEYGEQMPMAVLRLAARAASSPDADICLEVDVANVVVSGTIEICGDVIAERLDPVPSPYMGPPMMPYQLGEPTIAGVLISDRMLDVNSYPMLDIADVVGAPACLDVQASSNDVHTTVSLAICESVRLEADDTLTVSVGAEWWAFAPDFRYDEDGALPVGQMVDTGIELQNVMDDVLHDIEMTVRAYPGCPWSDR